MRRVRVYVRTKGARQGPPRGNAMHYRYRLLSRVVATVLLTRRAEG